MKSIVSVASVTHVYSASGKKSPARQALNNVSFDVAPGEIFGLLGPNGGGKSTLFRILSTYFPPTSGRATVYGFNLATQIKDIRPHLGVVFQNPSVDAKLSVRENMVCSGRLYGLGGAELSRRINQMLSRYRLEDRADEPVGGLSGGLRRRVELAKALLHRPELLLLDEPSTGLDPAARKDLWDHLAELNKAGVTILTTTHLMDEAEHCGRLAILDRGQIAVLGTPTELKSTIGGDVLTIESDDPLQLQKDIKSRFGDEASLLGLTLRIEKEKGHAFIPSLIEAFPGRVRSVSLSRPTLEDVFIHHTGRRFWTEEQSQ